MSRLIDADELKKRLNKEPNIITEETLLYHKSLHEILEFAYREFQKRVLWMVKTQPRVDAKPVVHGEWMLEAYKEPNYHWSVKAECSNCCHENGEVWGAYFPNVPDSLAKDTALLYASEVKISNFCSNCGADMRGEKNEFN